MRRVQAGAILIAAALAAGCSSAPKEVVAAPKPQPVAVRTAAVETRQVERAIAVTGSLEPDETVSVSAEVPGRIASLPVDFGQSVSKGQVIAQLDTQELSFQVERSKAALAQALARVGLDASQENVKPESSPAIRQVLAQAEDAKSKYESAARLVKTGDISQERFTELEKSYWARKAGLEAAQDELRMQMANVRALKADVKLAEKRLRDATVRAPFDGSISQKQVAMGQYIKENTVIVTLVKTRPLRLKLEVPEPATGAVKVGTALTFTTDAAPGAQFQAVVRELNPSVDAKSRSLVAEARLTNEDARLRPGMFVAVQLVTSRNAEIVVVPKAAMYTVAGLSKVFVVRSGRIVECKVTPGQQVGEFIEVPADQVRPGDRVATEKLGQLFQGAEVKG